MYSLIAPYLSFFSNILSSLELRKTARILLDNFDHFPCIFVCICGELSIFPDCIIFAIAFSLQEPREASDDSTNAASSALSWSRTQY